MKAFFGQKGVAVKPDARSLPERILDFLLPKKAIVNCLREVYLHRWYVIRSENFGLFIHKFVRSDEDRALHDRLWSFVVIPLWRGYVEHNLRRCYGDANGQPFIEDCPLCKGTGWRENKTRVRPILGTRCRPATYRHRVQLLERELSPHTVAICGPINPCLPAWSIFIRFRKVRDWGFWLPEGFKQWATFWQEKCE